MTPIFILSRSVTRVAMLMLFSLVAIGVFSVSHISPIWNSHTSFAQASYAASRLNIQPAWRVVPSPNQGSGDNSLSDIAVESSISIWAVGAYIDPTSGLYHTLIEHWDGSSWSIVPSPDTGPHGSYLSAVTVVSTNDIWAVGTHNSEGGYLDMTLVEHWNGTTWSVVPSPNIDTDNNNLYDIGAVSADDVWAAGDFEDVNGVHRNTLAIHWDGTTWSTVPSPNVERLNHLYGMSVVAADDVWAVGNTWSGAAIQNHSLFTGTVLHGALCRGRVCRDATTYLRE